MFGRGLLPMKIVLRCAVLVAYWFFCASSMADFQAGVATASITPDPLLPISGGMGPSAPATESKGDLSVRALVLRQGDERVAIVSVDVLGFPSVLGKRAQTKIRDIPASNVLIAASHTHSAPDCYAFPDGKGGHTGNLEYMEFVCDQIAKVVNEASDKLQPATLRIATGEVKGRVAYNYYAPDLYDRRASIIQLTSSATKQPMATLVNYAVHPEVLGANVGICSPDLVGPMRSYIESQVGGTAMFVNGAQGGMVTADNRDLNAPSDAVRGYWKDHRTWEECERIGKILGREAVRILETVKPQATPKLRCHHRDVKFPVDSDDMWSVVQYSPLRYPHGKDRTITSRINFLELGNAKILTIPGEALPNIGFYLKRKLAEGKQAEKEAGENHQLLFGLTNDAFGYILTKEDFQSFPRYDYISRVSLGERTAEILIQNALEMAQEQSRGSRE